MINPENQKLIESAKKAALKVLIHNAKGPFYDLPRTAGWGYPEPYTRDLLISIFGIAVSKNEKLIYSLKKVLLHLAKNQSKNGQIPSIVCDRNNLGSSDTTPLFLIAAGIFRKILNDSTFLKNAVDKAIIWMEYQSPTNDYLIVQQPTSDWRDEQWVLGYGLFVNTLMYTGHKLLENEMQAQKIKDSFGNFIYQSGKPLESPQPGLAIRQKPYYALWSFKIYSSERFDLLGNSLAILSGLSSISKSREIIEWVEKECEIMTSKYELGVGLSPNFFPYIKPEDSDWHDRYFDFNKPGDYHNGGVWPFISGFHIAALVSVKEYDLAEKHLLALTKLVTLSKSKDIEYGFNEWYKAQNGRPMGQDWQTWSASNYLYAAHCVKERKTPFFEGIRN